MNNKNLTQKEQEQLQLEKQKENRTKKLFKRLKKNYNILLFDIVQDIIKTINSKLQEPINDGEAMFDYLLQHRELIVDNLIQQLKQEYYNDNRYYCNNELFHSLKSFYLLKYKSILKTIISALF